MRGPLEKLFQQHETPSERKLREYLHEQKSGTTHEFHVDIQREHYSFQAQKRGFFSLFATISPYVERSSIQLRLIAHIHTSVVIFRNRETLRALKFEFTSRFSELRTFFWIIGGSWKGSTVGEGSFHFPSVSWHGPFGDTAVGVLWSSNVHRRGIYAHRRRGIRESGVLFRAPPEIRTGMRSSIQSGLKRYISEPILCLNYSNRLHLHSS